ncbi:MAG: hypothetical protein MJ025_02345 [Victivallaceae bacterium]|nr:hypothetical protein [Victivallaceae bacterium]
MKTHVAVLLCLVSALCLAAGPKKLAPLMGKGNQKIFLFHGGRPWQGDETCKFLVAAGMCVYDNNSAYLDALGGATIKAHPTDRVEPVAFDGLTPAFNKLDPKKHAAAVFHLIPGANYRKIFTKERVSVLKSYIEKGGNLVVFRPFPAGVIDDLLPVKPGEDVQLESDAELVANRPEGKIYSCLPKILPIYGFYQSAELRPGAEAISIIKDECGDTVAPLIARTRIGRGTVTFCNVERRLPRQIKEFDNWGYKAAFFAAVIADSARLGNVEPQKLLARIEDFPERHEVRECTVSAKAPENGIFDSDGDVKLDGRTAIFANGCRILVRDNGRVDITAPGKSAPYLVNYGMPDIMCSNTQAVYDSATAEATEVKTSSKTAGIKWKLANIGTNGRELVLAYDSPNARMRWTFKGGRLELDGRTFQGIGDRVEVESCPLLVSGIQVDGELHLENPLFAHRNDCYQPPRGYTAFDMTGASDATTRSYAGQPFEMVVCKDSLYIGNRSFPEYLTACLSRQKGSAFIKTAHHTTLGRIKAPFSNNFYWHWLGDGTERGHNDYLAMYQFMRSMLRRQAGLDELPGYPVAKYGYLKKEEATEFIQEAVRMGFRYIWPPMPESPLEEIDSKKNIATYNEIRDAGAGVWLWTAGSYVQGDGGRIIREHPDWFVKDEKGKILQYFGTYPVIDVNRPELYDFCIPIFEKAMENGVTWFYRDMDAGAGSIINYGVPISPSGVPAQIRFYRFFHDHGCRVSVEGMNPLVLDEYMYRPSLYTSFSGREFAMVGQTPNADVLGATTLDQFRLAMYNCFLTWPPEGLIFNIERIPNELGRSRRASGFIRKFNETIDHVGMPYVRETEFGTVWIGNKGGALFFWNPAKKVTVELPDGWSIRGVKGNVLTDVKPDTIILLDAK